ASVFKITYDDASSPRDPLGRVLARSITRGATITSVRYTYDDKGQLTQVIDGAATRNYAYDADGNRCQLENGETLEECFAQMVYDDQDRLMNARGVEYEYTARGTLRAKHDGTVTTTYKYDALGNLTNVISPAHDITYTIDGFGRRVAKKV